MAVGASQPTVVATKDGRISLKSQMQVNLTLQTVTLLWILLTILKLFSLA